MRDEYLRRRLWRKLESLPDERLYQVVDYVEFLESKYGETPEDPDGIQRFAEGIQDRLRRRRRAPWALRGVMGALGVVDRAVGSAARAVRGLAEQIGKDEPSASSQPVEERSTERSTRIVVE